MNNASPLYYGILPGISIGESSYVGGAPGRDIGDFYGDLFFRFISPSDSEVTSFHCVLTNRAIEISFLWGWDLQYPGVPYIANAYMTLHTALEDGSIGPAIATSNVLDIPYDYDELGDEESLLAFTFTDAPVIPKGEIGYLRFYHSLTNMSLWVEFAGIDSFNTQISDWSCGRIGNDGHYSSIREAAGLLVFADEKKMGSPWVATQRWQRQRTTGVHSYNWNMDGRTGDWNSQGPSREERLDWQNVAGGQITLPVDSKLYAANVSMFIPTFLGATDAYSGQDTLNPAPISSLIAHVFQEGRYIASSSSVPVNEYFNITWQITRNCNHYVQFWFSPFLLEANKTYQLVVEAGFVEGTPDVVQIYYWPPPNDNIESGRYTDYGWMHDFQHDDQIINPHYFFDGTSGTDPATTPFDTTLYLWRLQQYPAINKFRGWSLDTVNSLNPYRFPFINGTISEDSGIPVLTCTVEQENDAGISLLLQFNPDSDWNYTPLAALKKRRHHGI